MATNPTASESNSGTLQEEVARLRERVEYLEAELARRAGIRPETLNRIEQAKHAPSVPTVAKIEEALREAETGNK